MSNSPFKIKVPEDVLHDLRNRLQRTRWSDAVAKGWSFGTDKNFLEQLIHYWLTQYNWREREEEMNTLPQFHTQVGTAGVHFIHSKAEQTNATPLLLLNGWPSSFVEYTKILPRLTHPSRFGGEPASAFDVVIPAMPGFGFSDRPVRPFSVNPVSTFHGLMRKVLGYSKFVVAGTDIGARVATRMALAYPKSVQAIHIATVDDPPLTANSPPLTSSEQAYLERSKRWAEEEGAYGAIQSTRPQTVAFALADSPAGLASWIVEKYYLWTDHGGDLTDVFPMDTLLDTIMIYWVTGTIGSSMRHYKERSYWRPPHRPEDRVRVPTGVLMMPKDLAFAPREWAERLYNVSRYTALERGGHFPAWEVPSDYASELIAIVDASREGPGARIE